MKRLMFTALLVAPLWCLTLQAAAPDMRADATASAGVDETKKKKGKATEATAAPIEAPVVEGTNAGEATEGAEAMTEPQEAPVETVEAEVGETSVAEVAGKVDSMGEAFTELKNTVDVLNRMKFSGYLQAQYVNDESTLNELTSPNATRNRDQFSIRRARIKFTYQATPNSRFVFQPEITTSGTSIKDAWVEYTEPYTPWKNTLTAGQFNWPFGFEVGFSSSDRELPERSRVIRALFPGERDRGVMVSGRGFAERFTYAVAIVNGSGTTQSFDSNKRKDTVGRVGMNLGALDLGLSIYRGRDLVATTLRPKGIEFDKEREGFDFQLITPIPGLGLRGEYISGKERGADVDGWYFYAIQNLGTRNQIAVRIDEYDPISDLDSTPATQSVRTIGGSYIFHWDAHSKFMFTYEKPELDGLVDPKDNVFTLRLQYKL